MNRTRVLMLRNMIAGIPAKRIDLNYVWSGDRTGIRTAPKPCGAVACIAGWAMIYPPFIADGIQAAPGTVIDKVRAFLDLSVEQHPLLYAAILNERGTAKQIALKRLDALLATGTDVQRSAVE